jgi:hypothetical protein
MGYGNPDLEEMSDSRLLDELERRVQKRADGRCIYCGGWLQQKPGCAHAAAHMQSKLPPSIADDGLHEIGQLRIVLK